MPACKLFLFATFFVVDTILRGYIRGQHQRNGVNDVNTDNRKIDIYLLNRSHKCWQYECTTTWSKTCRDAKASFLRRHDYLDAGQVRARFA